MGHRQSWGSSTPTLLSLLAVGISVLSLSYGLQAYEMGGSYPPPPDGSSNYQQPSGTYEGGSYPMPSGGSYSMPAGGSYSMPAGESASYSAGTTYSAPTGATNSYPAGYTPPAGMTEAEMRTKYGEHGAAMPTGTMGPPPGGYFDVAEVRQMDPKEFMNLSAEEMAKFAPESMRHIDTATFRTMDPAQFEGLSPEQMHALMPEQIRNLNTDVVHNMGHEQFSNMDKEQMMAFMPTQIRSLHTDVFKNMTAEDLFEFGKKQMQVFSPQQVKALDVDLFVADPDRFNDLGIKQMRTLTKSQIQDLDGEILASLDTKHVRAFKPSQFTLFSEEQWAGVDADFLAACTAKQTHAIPAEAFDQFADFADEIPPEFLARLTPAQKEAALDTLGNELTADQLEALGVATAAE